MTNLETLVIELQLKTASLEKGLAESQAKIRNFGKAAEESAGGMGKLRANIGETVKKFAEFFAVAEVIGFLKESSRVAAEDAKSFALLQNQLQNTLGATEKQTKAIDDQLESMGEASGTMLPQMRQAFGTLVRATGDTTRALQLQKLALDLSAGAHVPVGAAAKALGRALVGNTGALLRMDPSLKGSTNMLGLLQKHFKGAAQAAADANPYTRLAVVMDKIKVTLGKAVLPIVVMFSGLLIKLMPVITQLAGFISKLVATFAPFISQLISALLPALSLVMKMILELSKQVMPNLVKIMGDVVIPLVQLLTDVFADVIPIVMMVIEAVEPFITLLINILAPILHIIINLFDKLMKVLKPVADFIKGFVVRAFQILADMLGPLWNGILKPLIEGIEKLLGIKVNTSSTHTVKMKADAKGLGKSALDALDKSLLNVSSAPKVKKAAGSKSSKSGGHTINTTVNAKTDASAHLIAQQVVNAIKFNIPVAGNMGGGFSSMGSQVSTG